MPVNYQDSKIYRILCDEVDEVYVGSTTRPLCMRFAEHRHDYRKIQEGKRLRRKSTVCKIMQHPSARIELVEAFPCNNREELNTRESQVIRRTKCVNRQDPITGKMMDRTTEARVATLEQKVSQMEKTLQNIFVYKNNGSGQGNAGGTETLRGDEKSTGEVLPNA